MGMTLPDMGSLEPLRDSCKPSANGPENSGKFFPEEVLNDPLTLPYRYPRIAFRAVSRGTDSRTAIACLVPPNTPLTDRAPYMVFYLWDVLEQAFVLGVIQ